MNKNNKSNVNDKDNSCKIYYNSEFVEWTINTKNIEDTLIGNNNEKGLLFLNVESAGVIEFKDSSCKINKNREKLCNKTMNSKLKFKNGNSDSVYTPLSVVNFHTHPLNCYIDADTIWGWPSGEDLGQCMNFANENNITHIIFAIEGTYVIDVNKSIIMALKQNKSLFNRIRKNIEEIFKLTHKHRMYYNDSNPDITLENEFNEIFLKPLGLKEQRNILLSWLLIVNSLTLRNLIKLSNQFSKYFQDIKPINKIDKDLEMYLDINIFSITFFKNKTIQWDNHYTKEKIYNQLRKKDILIEMPNKIEYKAPFISEKCTL